MKKIIGIIAAVAMVASVFAADVAAQVKLSGSLLKYDKDADKFSALEIHNNAKADYNRALGFSASDDNAGASFDMWFVDVKDYSQDQTDTRAFLVTNNWKIWLKPFDMLKITAGDYGFNLNQEHIGWYRSQSGESGKGYGLDITPVDNVSLSVALLPGWGNFWFSGKQVATTAIKFETNVDAVKINALLSTSSDADGNFNAYKIGAGIAGNIGSVSAFANLLLWLNKNNVAKDGTAPSMGVEKLLLETYFEGNAGSLGWKIWAPIGIYTNGYAGCSYYNGNTNGAAAKWTYDHSGKKDSDKDTLAAALKPGKRKYAEVSPILYGQVGVSSLTLSVQADFCDLIGLVANSDDFKVTLTPKVAGNVGMCAWDISTGLTLGNGASTGFDVGLNLTVSF